MDKAHTSQQKRRRLEINSACLESIPEGHGDVLESNQESDYLHDLEETDVAELLELAKIMEQSSVEELEMFGGVIEDDCEWSGVVADCLNLIWKENADKMLKFRAPLYNGTSKRTKEREVEHQRYLTSLASTNQSITSHFSKLDSSTNSCKTNLPQSDDIKHSKYNHNTLKQRILELTDRTAIHRNARIEKKDKSRSKFQYLQALTIRRYFELILAGDFNKMDASSVLANIIFRSTTHKNGSQSQSIRTWANLFYRTGTFKEYKRGTKDISL